MKTIISSFFLTLIFILIGCGEYTDYHCYDEISHELIELENLYPSISQLWIIGESHETRSIFALKISDNVESDEDEPVVYIDGGIHGNEWIAVEVAFYTAKHLLENYESDSRIHDIVNGTEIWIVPMLNPDGHNYLSNQLVPELASFREVGRKNRRDNSHRRSGVDLNSNFDSDWGNENEGSSHDPSSIFYCGPFTFSEPETAAVRDLLYEHPPSVSISYHSFGQYIAYARENDSTSIFLAETMAMHIEDVNGMRYDFEHTYKSGGEKEWIYDTFSCPSFVVELRPDSISPGYMLPQAEIQLTAEENIAGSLFLMEWAIDNHTN